MRPSASALHDAVVSERSAARRAPPGKHRSPDSFLLFPGMAASDHFMQIAELEARVDFGRGKPAMAQQLLYVPDVGAAS
jgi:hypothetical protein